MLSTCQRTNQRRRLIALRTRNGQRRYPGDNRGEVADYFLPIAGSHSGSEGASLSGLTLGGVF